MKTQIKKSETPNLDKLVQDLEITISALKHAFLNYEKAKKDKKTKPYELMFYGLIFVCCTAKFAELSKKFKEVFA